MKLASPYPLPHDASCPHYEFSRDHGFSLQGGRTLRHFAAVIPCLFGIGCLYQAIATELDRQSYPPPGSVIDIDGIQIHMQTYGSGPVTVILETGLGGMSAAWGWIQRETAKFARVVSYDRAGLGWSEIDTEPKTAHRAARRLHDLLCASQISPPYVLVGHSMGGLLMRVFTDNYADDVVGMVMLDACHPDQHLRSTAIGQHMQTGFRVLQATPLLTRLGYVRLAGLFNGWTEGLPPRQAAEAGMFLSCYRHLLTTREECQAWDQLCSEVRRTGGLGNLPLAVVTAGKDVLPGQPELQGELAALSSDTMHLVVKGADHVTLVTTREHALTVAEVIRQVVEKGITRWQKAK